MLFPATLLLSLATLSLGAKKAPAVLENNPDSSAGKTLYITSPACGFFRCAVTWTKGSKVNVNWLGPPSGRVSVALASNNGGSLYPIIGSFPGTTTDCDAGGGLGVSVAGAACGGLSFIVPGGWEERSNYTIVVQSLSTESDVGYTDAITIAPAVGGANAPAGNSVTVLGASGSAASASANSFATSPSTSGGAVASVASAVSGSMTMSIGTSRMSTATNPAPTGALGTSVAPGTVPAATASTTTAARSSAQGLLKSLGAMMMSGVAVAVVLLL